MKQADITYDTTYVGKDGTRRYVDDFDEDDNGNEEVIYYTLVDVGQAPRGFCSLKSFAAWAVGVADQGLKPSDIVNMYTS
jgi:hypothetical protein